MRRYSLLAAVLVSLAVPTAGLAVPAGAALRPSASGATELAAFHFGGGSRRGFGGGGLFRRGGRSRHILRRIAHTLAIAYVLHLLFSHGGLSILIWIVVIGLVVYVFRRRRRRPAW